MLNTISLRGILSDKMTATTSINGGTTYHGSIEVTRQSGTVDVLPFELEERKSELKALIDQRVQFEGQQYYTVITFDRESFNLHGQ